MNAARSLLAQNDALPFDEWKAACSAALILVGVTTSAPRLAHLVVAASVWPTSRRPPARGRLNYYQIRLASLSESLQYLYDALLWHLPSNKIEHIAKAITNMAAKCPRERHILTIIARKSAREIIK
jgi:hypothetical protein